MQEPAKSGPSPSGPPPLFTKRERYALGALSIGFVAASALLHLFLGSLGQSLFPTVKAEPSPPPIIVSFDRLATPTPTPRPLVTPTPAVSPMSFPPRQPQRPVVDTPKRPRSNQRRRGEDTKTATPVPVATISDGANVEPTSAPPTTPQPQSTQQPAQSVVDSDFIRRVTPDYPELAKSENAQGDVVIRVTIGPDGAVEQASVTQSSGNAQLDATALKAAEESTFRPPMTDGKPTTREYLIVYTFALDD